MRRGTGCSSEAHTKADPVNPRLVFHALNQQLPDDAIITADAGTTADWYGHHIRARPRPDGQPVGPPRHDAGRDAVRDRRQVRVPRTAGRLHHRRRRIPDARDERAASPSSDTGAEWANPTFVVLVLHNDDLNQVSWEMREAGDPRYDTSQLLEDVDYAGYAKLLGLDGHPSRRPRRGRGGMGAGVRRRPAGRARRHHRQERPTAARAHHVEQAKGVARVAAQRRPRCGRGHRATAPGRWRRRCSPASARRSEPAMRLTPAAAANRRRRGRSWRHADAHRTAGTVETTVPSRSRSRHAPESDGTLDWDATTIVVRRGRPPGTTTGVGYTYAAPAAASWCRHAAPTWSPGRDALAPGRAWAAMVDAIRNHGRPGVAGSAISAVDIALWDLKAKLLGVSVADAVGRCARRRAGLRQRRVHQPSTTASWPSSSAAGSTQGIRAVKMKVGRRPAPTIRAGSASPAPRSATTSRCSSTPTAPTTPQAGPGAGPAVRRAGRDVVRGAGQLRRPRRARLVRDRARPPGMEITAGEYGYDLPYFRPCSMPAPSTASRPT